jgi:hypothetical protein
MNDKICSYLLNQKIMYIEMAATNFELFFYKYNKILIVAYYNNTSIINFLYLKN